MTQTMTQDAAQDIAGTLGFPSKMPGTAYGIPAQRCITGSKLVAVPGTVCHGCYALDRNNYRFAGVKQSQETRFASLTHPLWVQAQVKMLRAAHGLDGHKVHRKIKDPGYHRWHDSGDLQSVEHLARICEIARQTPEIKHWIPTREISIVLAFVRGGGIVPANLAIRVSATKVDGKPTTQWPLTSGVHEHTSVPEHERCTAPDHDGQCGPCRDCWDTSVPHKSYHKHA